MREQIKAGLKNRKKFLEKEICKFGVSIFKVFTFKYKQKIRKTLEKNCKKITNL